MNAASGPSEPPESDVHGLLDVLVHVGDVTAEADVGDLGLGAGGRAAREVHADHAGVTLVTLGELGIERPGPLDGALLGLDHREAAELRARTGDDTPLEGTRERRVGLQQSFGQEIVDPVLGDPRNHEVLIGPDPHVAVAVGLGQAGQLNQLDPVHPAHRHRAADVDQAVLLLRVHADVVPAEAAGQLAAGRLEGESRALVQGGAESLRAEFLGQVAHAGQPAVLTVAQLAEELGHAAAQLDGLVGPDEEVDVRGHPLTVGEAAADEHVEADGAVGPLRRPEADVVDLDPGAVLGAAGDGDLELARQVGVLPVAGEEGGDGLGHGEGVDHLVRCRSPRPGRSRRCAPSHHRPARWSARPPRTAARCEARRRSGSSAAECPGVW